MIQNRYKAPFNLNIKFIEAYQDNTPPPDTLPNHPVGHAITRLRVENLSQDNINVDVRRIEIRRFDNKKVLLFQVLKSLNLKGLQIWEQEFHLTSSEGFENAKKLKAVVNYQFSGKNYTVESATALIRSNKF